MLNVFTGLRVDNVMAQANASAVYNGCWTVMGCIS